MWPDIAVALLVPGWHARDRRRWLAVVLFVAGVVVPIVPALVALASGRSWLALSLDGDFLAWVTVAMASATASRLVAAAELWVARARGGDPSRDRVAWLLVGVVCLPLLVGAVQVGRARAAIAPAFTPTAGVPLYEPAAPGDSAIAGTAPTTDAPVANEVPVVAIASGPRRTATPSTTSTTVPPKPSRPDSGVDPALLADVTTVLLLGGDAGPGRYGLRTDTMMLFSLHRPSGRASLISIPRNLERVLFPPGSELERRYPYGFDDLANAVYPIVSARTELRAAYENVEGVRPGVVALAQAIGYSLDVTIDDYVLIDMQGFIDVIDALGGVEVDVPKSVPMPGNVPGARTQYPAEIGPGRIAMDGSTALGYVRSRKGDTDYHRARRQRDLLAGLATQVSFEDLATSFGSISQAVGGTLRTSLTPDELAGTLAVIGGETAIVESVGLVPPLVDVRRPDYQQLARVVGEVRLALATGQPSGW